MNNFEQPPQFIAEDQESHEELGKYVYHQVPLNLKGDVLYPLNELKEKYPEIYQEVVAKYEGREHVMEERIPIGEAGWNDVLQFSAVHPEKIREALKESGARVRTTEWYQIPVSLLNPDQTVIGFDAVSSTGEDKMIFKPFSEEGLREAARLPTETKQYYREQLTAGERPLLFYAVPHIFYKGSIPLKESTKITV